jgi:glutathione peroxidase-family protein
MNENLLIVIVETPPMKHLAKVYGITRQGLYHMMERNGLTRAELLQPEIVFQKLLTNRASHLRKRLSNPKTRSLIQKQISKLL